MSEELIEEYLSHSLISFAFSESEFQERVRTQLPELDLHTINGLYREYESSDTKLLHDIKDIIHKKYASITSKMEQEEIETSISLAETNDVLKKVDGMLKKRVDVLKDGLELKNERFSTYLDELSEIRPINLSLMLRIRNLIDALEDKST